MPIDFPNSPSTNATFTAGGVTWRYDGSKWGLDGYASGPTYETSLPASPVDGQEIYYAADATNGVIWHLRYRSGSSSSYKWEYVGGGALRATNSNGRSVTNQTSYTDVPTDTITVTIPLAGEYLVDHRAHLIVGGGARVVYSSFAITNSSNTVQTEASDTNAILIESVNATGISGFATATVAQIAKYEITTAGWKLRERIRTGGNYQGEIYRRNVVATPIRVG